MNPAMLAVPVIIQKHETPTKPEKKRFQLVKRK